MKGNKYNQNEMLCNEAPLLSSADFAVIEKWKVYRHVKCKAACEIRFHQKRHHNTASLYAVENIR